MVSAAATCSELLLGAGFTAVVLAALLIAGWRGAWSRSWARAHADRAKRGRPIKERKAFGIERAVVSILAFGLVVSLMQLIRC